MFNRTIGLTAMAAILLASAVGIQHAPAAAGSPPLAAQRATGDIDTILVSPGKHLYHVPSSFLGINYVAFWDKAQGSHESAIAMKRLGVRTVRFPGGAPANSYDWQDPYYRKLSITSPLDVWKWARSFGATNIIFGTNVTGGAKQGASGAVLPPPPGKPYAVNSPANAAAWVAYDKTVGIPAAMEVGNEEDLRLIHVADDPSYTQYLDTFDAQARAMHAADPGVKVLGPVAANAYYWLHQGALSMFLKSAGNRSGSGQADGVSLHFYGGRDWFSAENQAQLWQTEFGPFIHQTLRANDTRNLPIYITEWNVGAAGQNNSFNATVGHGLLVADMLGAFASSGVAGEDYFTIHGAKSWGLLYGPADKTRPIDSPTPAYYAMALWQHMGTVVIPAQTAYDPGTVLSSYATTGKHGAVQVLAVNKRPGARELIIELQGYNPAGHHLRAYSFASAGGGIGGLDARYNGVKMPPYDRALPEPINVGTVRGKTISYRVPGYSAVVLSLDGSRRDRKVHWHGPGTPRQLPEAKITVSGQASATNLKPGATQTLSATIRSNQSLGPVLVEFDVYGPDNSRVYVSASNGKLSARSSLTTRKTFTLPTASLGGTYRVAVSVYGPGGSPLYASVPSASTFSVVGPPPPQVSAAGKAEPTRVHSGGMVTLTADVTVSGSAVKDAIVVVAAGKPGARLCARTTRSVTIPAGKTAQFHVTCAVPSNQPTGQYTEKIGVFARGFKTRYKWVDPAASFEIAP